MPPRHWTAGAVDSPRRPRSGRFSLHAAVAIHEHDRLGLERLARYCARPALSLDRLSILDDGRVRYRMKRVFSDGRSEVVLDPHDFLVRICALIPPPRVHLVRYFGAFAGNARDRAALTGRATAKPPAPVAVPSGSTLPQTSPPTTADPPPDPDRPRRLDWQALLMRVHKLDVLLCNSCGGRLAVVAFLADTKIVRRILHHLGIPPGLINTRARSPPAASFPFAIPVEDPLIDPTACDAD